MGVIERWPLVAADAPALFALDAAPLFVWARPTLDGAHPKEAVSGPTTLASIDDAWTALDGVYRESVAHYVLAARVRLRGRAFAAPAVEPAAMLGPHGPWTTDTPRALDGFVVLALDRGVLTRTTVLDDEPTLDATLARVHASAPKAATLGARLLCGFAWHIHM